jgi:hypothetical protein
MATWSYYYPGAPNSVENYATAYTFGALFRTRCGGNILGIRFYKDAGDAGAHTAALYTGGGALLASKAFSGETASGWQYQAFDAPVPISAWTDYVAAYLHAGTGNWRGIAAVDLNDWANPLIVRASPVSARFITGSTLQFPNTVGGGAEDFVDFVFDDLGNSFTPPMVRDRNGSRGVVGWLKDLKVAGNILRTGINRDDAEGSPSSPCLRIDTPNFWRFRWGVTAGTRTISISAKQVSNVAGKRPSLIIKANPDIGIAADVAASAPLSTDWVTIGPISVAPTRAGVLWVELWNDDTDTFNSPAFFDHIIAR